MVRLFLIAYLFISFCPFSYGQLSVYQDVHGQVFTTVEGYGAGTINSTSYRKLTYTGSPFLTFPVWQPGRVRLDEAGKYVACDIAYDLVSNVVLCRFPGDSAVQTLRPERFTIDSDEFIRQQNKPAGFVYKIYGKGLSNGRTRLLLSLSKRNEPYARAASTTGYEKETNVNGGYVLQEKYYIRKGDARPEQISLTKNAVLSVLYEQADKISPRLGGRRLVPADIIAILPYYDSLMTVERASKPAVTTTQAEPAEYVQNKAPLSNELLFTETLHQRIHYPETAWARAIYGRVYAGFDIDQQGRVGAVTILSPDNGGVGFVEAVRSGLETLPMLSPAFAGSYVLPVAFTYINKNEPGQTHAPVNRLSDDRLTGRTLLEEIAVPVVVTKPVQTSREVWGYYK